MSPLNLLRPAKLIPLEQVAQRCTAALDLQAPSRTLPGPHPPPPGARGGMERIVAKCGEQTGLRAAWETSSPRAGGQRYAGEAYQNRKKMACSFTIRRVRRSGWIRTRCVNALILLPPPWWGRIQVGETRNRLHPHPAIPHQGGGDRVFPEAPVTPKIHPPASDPSPHGLRPPSHP